MQIAKKAERELDNASRFNNLDKLDIKITKGSELSAIDLKEYLRKRNDRERIGDFFDITNYVYFETLNKLKVGRKEEAVKKEQDYQAGLEIEQ